MGAAPACAWTVKRGFPWMIFVSGKIWRFISCVPRLILPEEIQVFLRPPGCLSLPIFALCWINMNTKGIQATTCSTQISFCKTSNIWANQHFLLALFVFLVYNKIKGKKCVYKNGHFLSGLLFGCCSLDGGSGVFYSGIGSFGCFPYLLGAI